MQGAAVVVVFCLAAVVLHASLASASCTNFGVPNTLPIDRSPLRLVRQVPNGKLYLAGSGQDQIYVVHLYGEPYDWGVAEGQLLKNEITYVLTNFMLHLEQTIENGLPDLPQAVRDFIAQYGLIGALELTALMTADYTPKHFFEEMRGMANSTGLSYETILNVHMLPELVQAACSMFGAWGTSTPDGSLYQLRALDWDTSGPLQMYPTVTVYHPKAGNGHAFANVAWAGFIGTLTGMSSVPLGISEKVGDDFGWESRIGVPWHFLLRDILQFDMTLDDAINRMANAARTCNIYLGIGDGNQRQFRLFEYGWSELLVFNPLNTPFTPRIPDIVYRGVNQDCLSQQLQKYSAQHNVTAINTIRDVVSISKTGDLHIAVYDHNHMIMYVANARSTKETGPLPAYNRQFVQFNMNALFSQK